jgi:hypothetical protein
MPYHFSSSLRSGRQNKAQSVSSGNAHESCFLARDAGDRPSAICRCLRRCRPFHGLARSLYFLDPVLNALGFTLTPASRVECRRFKTLLKIKAIGLAAGTLIVTDDGGARLAYQSSAVEFGARFCDTVDCRLSIEPCGEFSQAFF